MKRVGFFALWTLVFWAFALMASRQAVIFQKSMDLSSQPTDFREGVRRGVELRTEQFSGGFQALSRYWHVTLICAIIASGLGSLTGILPGTRKARSLEPPPLPPQ